MKRTQRSPWIAALLAMLAGTSGADVEPSIQTQPPRRLELPAETGPVPAACRMFLEVPADSRSEALPWQQRLSVAACRQEIELAPVTDMRGLLAMLASLDGAMAPSIAIYREAIAGAPNDLRIMAAYGLGMTYVSTMVRARSAIRGAAYGGATYGQLDQARVLHASLEPLLVAKREAALAAFDEMARIAERDPAAARANQVVSWIMRDARRKVALLR